MGVRSEIDHNDPKDRDVSDELGHGAEPSIDLETTRTDIPAQQSLSNRFGMSDR